MAQREIRSLTGLRGLAAVFVMLYHFSGVRDTNAAPALSAAEFLSHGYLSVDVFFVLSGFVMALTYGRMFSNARGTWVALPVFLGHRIARIYPLYIVMTLFFAAVHLFGIARTEPIPNFGEMFVANLFLVQSWGLAHTLVSPAWSISTEWAAYLLFPVFLAVTVNGSRRVAWTVGLISVAVTVLLATTTVFGTEFADRNGPLDIWEYTTLGPMWRCLAGFCVGLLTYRVYRGASAAWLDGFAAISPLVLGLMVGSCLWPGADLIFVALGPVLILGLAADRGIVARVLASRPLHWLGVVSYAVYLVHPTLIKFSEAGEAALVSRGVSAAHAIIVVASCLVVVLEAYVAYRVIERPGRRWLRFVFDRLEARLNPAVRSA